MIPNIELKKELIAKAPDSKDQIESMVNQGMPYEEAIKEMVRKYRS